MGFVSARSAISISAVTILVGCSPGEPYEPPQANLPAGFAAGGGASIGTNQDVRWWSAFRDQRLDSLVSRGLSQNLGIRIAGERVAAARAVAGGAGVPVSGALDGRGGVTGGSDVDTEGFATGAFGASWLLDFFGRLSGERDLARAQLQAAEYGVEAAQLAFLSELTAAYIDARFFQESLALTRNTLASSQETLRLTERLREADAATVLDVSLARGVVQDRSAEIPLLEADFYTSAHRVSTLLGQPAGSLVQMLSAGAAQPQPRRIYAGGVPADLLRNRPDIQVAERELAAAAARVGIAQADLYPRISLLGNITGTVRGGDDASSWQFGPAVNLPIFGREALTANVSAREAEARAQDLLWRQTVLRAVGEVEDALVALNRSRRAVTSRDAALQTRSDSLELARESYSRGETPLLDLLEADRRVGDAGIALAVAKRRYALDFVALNVAIGAGRSVAKTDAVASDS